MKLKAIFFDLDGTLLDTDKLIFMSYQYLFKKYRKEYQLTFEELQSFLGPPLMEILPKYFDQNINTLIEEYRDYSIAHHRQFVNPIFGACDLLKELKARGYKIAVITSKRKDAALYGLKLFEMNEYIDYLVDCDMVKQFKPSPEGIFLALQELKVSADEVMMVGDSKSDILAGKNAKCWTTAVSYSLKGNFYHDLNPDYVIDCLKDLLKYCERVI